MPAWARALLHAHRGQVIEPRAATSSSRRPAVAVPSLRSASMMGTGRPRRSNRSLADLRARSASMTAMSAQRASGANPFPERTVLLPGSPAAYEHRAVLRYLGLRWDPDNHRWHGSLAPAAIRELREKHGLVVRCFGSLDLPGGPEPPTPVAPPRPVLSVPSLVSVQPIRDSSRTRAEARVVYREGDEDAEEIATPTRRFSLMEITSGLPDDSREAEERETARRLCDLRGRVKAARAAISAAPGAGEVLATDWDKEASFYARFGITQARFRHGCRTQRCPMMGTSRTRCGRG